MNRPRTGPPTLESRPLSRERTRLRAYSRRLEWELARDLVALVHAGLVVPFDPVAGAGEETLRFSVTEFGEVTAAGVSGASTGAEDRGTCEVETGD